LPDKKKIAGRPRRRDREHHKVRQPITSAKHAGQLLQPARVRSLERHPSARPKLRKRAGSGVRCMVGGMRGMRSPAGGRHRRRGNVDGRRRLVVLVVQRDDAGAGWRRRWQPRHRSRMPHRRSTSPSSQKECHRHRSRHRAFSSTFEDDAGPFLAGLDARHHRVSDDITAFAGTERRRRAREGPA